MSLKGRRLLFFFDNTCVNTCIICAFCYICPTRNSTSPSSIKSNRLVSAIANKFKSILYPSCPIDCLELFKA